MALTSNSISKSEYASYADLVNVSCAFSEIDSVADGLTDAVGHRGLGGRVHEFSANWDDRRKTIVAATDSLWLAAKSISSDFKDLDQQMASAFRAKD